MDTVLSIVISALLLLSLVVLVFLLARNAKLVTRIRRTEWYSKSGFPSGLDETGALTTGAKQAVRDYMLSIFAVGGMIGALIAGVAGYMINDLAKETALTEALTEMQKPVINGIQKLNEANSKVEDLRKRVEGLSVLVAKDEFVRSVVEKLASNDDLKKRIEKELVTQVSEQLVSKHRDKLRGERGKDGVSPTAEDVAATLASKYSDMLQGQPGKDGDSPTVSAVAAILVSEHRDKLRGPPGKDGVSPGAEEVAAILVSKHRGKLLEHLAKPSLVE